MPSVGVNLIWICELCILGDVMFSKMVMDRYLDYPRTLETSSEEVQKGVIWLEHFLDSEEVLEPAYALEFYVVSKFNSPLVARFVEKAGTDEFWEEILLDLFDYSDYAFYYLSKLGLRENYNFKDSLKAYLDTAITSGGQHWLGNTGISLLTLVSTGLFPTKLELLLRNTLESIAQDEDEYSEEDLENLALIGLALFELGYQKYRENIEKIMDYLLSMQKQKGYWGILRRKKDRKESIKLSIQKTFYIIEFLSRIRFLYTDVIPDRVFEKAGGWVKSLQNSNGSWLDDSKATSYALLTLISLGEGPKIPHEYVELIFNEATQAIRNVKPRFLATNPYRAEFSIKETLEGLFLGAEKRVWIISRYITEFFPDLIKLHKDNPMLDIRIITLPKAEKSGYKGAGKRFLDPAYDMLQRLLGDSFRSTSIIHARLYIVDDKVLITSADLTPEQLKTEFNAGILTSDPDVLSEAERFFLDIWELIQEDET